jgi:hypothetical protein
MCPHCKKEITLDEALTHPIEEEMRRKMESEYSKKKEELKKEFEIDKHVIEDEATKKAEKAVGSKLKDLEAKVKENDAELLKAQRKETELTKKFNKKEAELSKKFEIDRKKVEEEAARKAKKAADLEIKDLAAQVKEADTKIDDFHKKELEMRKRERELEAKLKNSDLEVQRKVDEEKKKARTEIAAEFELKLKDRDKLNDDLKQRIDELNRKAEQGSQQSQGEVLETTLQEVLEENFPHDTFDAISTGERGADIKQTVCLRSGKACGCILIEAKRTKNWSKDWIKKLKEDQLAAKADISVIASAALPDGVHGFDVREGIVIVDWRFLAPVISLLRNQVIEVARTKNLNAGREEKKDSLYAYVTGTDFRHVVESNVGVFLEMVNDLKKERVIAERNWSKREKQLQQSVGNIISIYGSMQGILGSSSLPELKQLNMDGHLLEDGENRMLDEQAAPTSTDEKDSRGAKRRKEK